MNVIEIYKCTVFARAEQLDLQGCPTSVNLVPQGAATQPTAPYHFQNTCPKGYKEKPPSKVVGRLECPDANKPHDFEQCLGLRCLTSSRNPSIYRTYRCGRSHLSVSACKPPGHTLQGSDMGLPDQNLRNNRRQCSQKAFPITGLRASVRTTA